MASGQRRRVQAIGNAIVDLEVEVDDRFVERLGVAKGQMMLVDAALQREVLAALEGHRVHRSSGGSAANTAVGIAELGGEAAFCGKVARDELGSFYLEDLRRANVQVATLPGDGQTGTCVVLVTPDAQRTMLTHLGAAQDLAAHDVAGVDLRGCAWLYVEGYLFTGEATRAAALAAIERAKAEGVRVALTASDPFVIDRCRDALWDLIDGPVDLLFCNEQEARALTRLDDVVECAREVHRHAASVALTLGPKGSLLMDDGTLHPVEGVPARAVDTTGAGDMYAAGVLYALAAGLDWPTAGHLASHAAARVVTQFGARLPRRFTPEEMAALSRRR